MISKFFTFSQQFWYTTNNDFGPTDGEVEYSARAGAAAHAIGRVTCQPDGVDLNGDRIDFKLGFFHTARSDKARSSTKEFVKEALYKMRDTQCDTSQGDYQPTGGLRLNTDMWVRNAAETDMNPEGGFCGMPTQFLGTVRVGDMSSIPRWVGNRENAAPNGRETYNSNQKCKSQMQMSLPWELLNISKIELPSSPALQKFLDIAWDGVDSINSAWDSCEVGCAIPILQNRLCGGTGLANYDWSHTFCHAGLQDSEGGQSCCQGSCGVVRSQTGELMPIIVLAPQIAELRSANA